ncbi:alpha/beta fold hydrolase [Streptomyces sp. MP131-18]|uniref:alpha/beta fold hydrolase n=1 Tax=Streptomyces sp. MP131-18 TaxID=1857892 RepID=UPI00097C2D9B|nr:alpha/beta fold hydrolase [Streptomyces sp. MP131-18]ONK09312.1 2-succinyl-6-hydroxy-2, 4-cyclohexadiene-1-carboxylate synthase [Streptomyces sp. MP131-18]
MPQPATAREVELPAGRARLSALLAEPATHEPRAVLVALHGGGMRAGYFHGRADPATSLLTLAAAAGYAALAIDRPGYGASAAAFPDGATLAEQATCLRAALRGYAATRPTGAGFLLVGHSLGGKLALTTAAGAAEDDLLGVDVSGVGERWALPPDRLARPRNTHRLHWGPLALYPPGTFRLAQHLVGPIPPREAGEMLRWPRQYPRLARRIRIPVSLTFAEHEHFWTCDHDAVHAMAARLAAPFVHTGRLAGAGHNISLGHAARQYHLRVLAFLEACRDRRSRPGPAERPGALTRRTGR